jgi:hypothetical protein
VAETEDFADLIEFDGTLGDRTNGEEKDKKGN